MMQQMLAGIFRSRSRKRRSRNRSRTSQPPAWANVSEILSYFLVNFKNANHRCPGRHRSTSWRLFWQICQHCSCGNVLVTNFLWCRISWIRWAFHFAILQNPCQPMSIVMFSMDMEEAAHLFAAYSHSWCWFAAWFRGPWLHWAMLCKVGISISCLCLRIPWLV